MKNKTMISMLVIILMLIEMFSPMGLIRKTTDGFITEALETDIKINFQTEESDVPDGYIADFGETYGVKTEYSYGWNTDHKDLTVSREVYSDSRLSSSCGFQVDGKWEIELTSGYYDVTVSVGDAVYATTNTIDVEDINYWENIELESNEFLEKMMTVEVTDGRLTVDEGESGIGTSLINYIIISPNEEIIPESSNHSIKLQMFNGNKTIDTNNLSPRFKLENTSTEPIDLEKLEIKYYYTVEGNQDQNFYCDWSNIGSNKITGDFVKLSQPSEKADHYLKLGFKTGAGNLEPGENVEIHTRFSKVDWSNYDQSDDYSFNQSATDYIDWNKVSVYFVDDLIWGEGDEALPPIPVVESMKVQMYNTSKADISTTIYPKYKLVNNGNVSIDLKDVKLRYYYTGEGEIDQNFYCDWSSIGSSNIISSFVELANPCEGADRYLELSFAQDTGELGPEGSFEIHTRMAQKDWSDYTQTNDYSFNESSSNYVDWDKVTVYINGELTWGIEPTEIPWEIINKELPLRIQMYNGNRSSNNNTIYPMYKIYNIGTIPVNLKDVKIRYIYTINGYKEQNFYCDWSNIGSSNIIGSFNQLPDSKSNGDYYFELGFKDGAGTIYPEEWVEVHTRFSKTDWANYTQTDDYSFNSVDSSYEDWTNVNGYLDEILIWGEAEFFGIPQDINLDATENTIDIEWDEVEFATDYEIEIDGDIYGTNGSKNYTHSGLLPGHEYTFRVRAITKAVKGNWSSEIKKWTLPSTPQNIDFQATSDSIEIEWDEVTGATGYDIEIDGEIQTDVTSPYIHGELLSGTEHKYRVRAKNSSGLGKWSDELIKWTIPDAPSFMGANDVTENEITIIWDDEVRGATGYDIEIDGKIQTDVTSPYTHEELLSGTEHKYRVRAKNSSGSGQWSDELTKWTLPDIPENIVVKQQSNSLVVSWDEARGATGYEIEVFGNVIDNGANLEYLHSGLGANMQYTYRVRAKNDSGVGKWSSIIAKATLTDIPKNLTTSATDTTITVTWDAVAGATGYEIEIDESVIEEVTESNYIHSGLMPNTSHKYRIRTKNSDGKSNWSDYIAETTLPSTPTGLSAAITDSGIAVTWAKVDGATSYDIEVDGVLIDNGLNTSYNHTNLEPNTEYTYRVRARNGERTSFWSSEIKKTTLLDIPANLKGIATSTEITISWDMVVGATGYDIEVDGQVMDNGLNTTFIHSGLVPNTEHTYRVRARSGAGAGEWSEAITKITLFGIPTNLTATSTSTNITLSWDEVPGATAYEVFVDGEVIDNGLTTTYIHDGLEPNTWHTYRVRARSGDYASDWSDGITWATLVGIPTNITAEATSTMITIKWDEVIGSTGYDIEVDGEVIDNGASITYIHGGLLPNTVHTYKVRAKNENGTSDWSSKLTMLTAPDIPKNLKATATTTEITITWDKVDGADSYDMEVDGVVVEDIQTPSYTHAELEPNTWHIYKVRSKNGGGTSEWSEELQQNTNPEIAVNVGKDTTFNFVIVAPEKEGVSTRTIVVKYNSNEVEVVDLCAVTPEINIETGKIEGTNITVTEFSPGEIKYTISDADKTVVNSIKFMAKVNEHSKITYVVE